MLKIARHRQVGDRELARVLAALEAGQEAHKIAREIALRHTNEADASDYARRIVDIASVRLWLADGVPLADTITMLQVRRRFELSSNDSLVYAAGIVATASKQILPELRRPEEQKKEPHNAVA